MALPCVLFSSSVDSYKASEFVKEILKGKDVPPPEIVVDGIESSEYYFENKYYSATVRLCATNNRTIGDKEFAECVEAFIHFFDPNQMTSFDLTKAWLPYLNHMNPEVQMLVCETSKPTDAVSRNEVLEWCLENGFELVELSPEMDEEEEEDDFPETNGMPRIIQALNAHTWPNMELKENAHVQSPFLRQMMKEQHLLNQQQQNNNTSPSSNEDVNSKEDSDKADNELTDSINKVAEANSVDGSCSSNEENGSSESKSTLATDATPVTTAAAAASEEPSLLDGVDWSALVASSFQEENDDVEEFEKLFMKLQVMKDKAKTLPLEERKKYAEEVAIAFWTAIGGDEDEIEGLDNDLY